MADEKKKSLVLEAQDAFSATFNDFRKGLNGIANDTATVRGQLGTLQGGLGALGVSFQGLFAAASVAGFAAFIKSATETEDKLYRVSKATGMSVESLSSMMPAAKEGGLALDDLAKMSEKLSKAQIESQDRHSKAATAMRALGISATDSAGKMKAPEQMALDVAKALDKFADGAGKTAIAQMLMGKSGAEALPFMKALADQGELGARVTTAQALEAKKFEDSLRTLQSQSGKLARDLANALLPATNDIIKAFIEAKNQAGLWEGAIAAVSMAFDKLAGTPEERMRKELATIQTTISAIREWQAATVNETVSEGSRTEQANNLNAALARRAQLQAMLFQQELEAQNARAIAGQQAAHAKPELNVDVNGAAGMKAYADEKAALQEKIALLGVSNELEALSYKLSKDKFKDLKQWQRDDLMQVGENFVETKAQVELEKEFVTVEEQLAAAETARGNAYALYRRDLQDDLQLRQTELDMIGHTNEEREHALLKLEREKALRRDLKDWQVAQVNAYFDERDALIDVTKARADSLSVWGEVADKGSKLFADMAMAGKGAFDVLKRELKSFAQEMIALFAKKFILQIAASATGGATGSALASQAAASGSGSLASAAGSAIGSYIGGAGTAIGGAYGASEGFAMGWGSGVAGPTAGFAETAGATLSSAYEAIASILAEIPVWGWIALAVVAVAAWITGNHKGGAKVGGSAFGTYDPATGLTTPSGAPGTQDGRFYTPNQADAVMQQAIGNIGIAYAAAAKALGGTPGKFGFGLGFDTDPNGRAADRLTSLLTGPDGRTLLSNTNISPPDGMKLEDAMSLEGQRMVLRALQESNLPPAIAAILKSVDALTASADDIQRVEGIAVAFKSLTDVLHDFSLGDILKSASRTPSDILGEQGAALVNLANNTKLTTDSLNNLSAATNQYKASVAQVILALQAVSVQVNEMFGQTSRNIRLSTMDPGQQYAFYRSEVADLYNQLQGAGSADEVTRITNLINQDLTSAWGLLSPDQQRALQADFLKGIDSANTRAQDRIHELQVQAAADAKQVLDRIETVMTNAANSITQAAQTIYNAAALVASGGRSAGSGPRTSLTTDGG